jgi:hypothetical protein
MTLYNAPPHPDWYLRLRRTVFKRAHGICEVAGCSNMAVVMHHRCYPTGRREEPRDMMAICNPHHLWFHRMMKPPANDNEEHEQLELALPANDNAARKREAS